MKRDMDLIRELMLKLESLPMKPSGIVHIPPDAAEVQVDGYGTDQIDYHLPLIEKAGLIDTGRVNPMEGIRFRSLSWAGHDFLDSVAAPMWDRTKHAASAAGGFTGLRDIAFRHTGFLVDGLERAFAVSLRSAGIFHGNSAS